jgi:hypothetical protein
MPNYLTLDNSCIQIQGHQYTTMGLICLTNVLFGVINLCLHFFHDSEKDHAYLLAGIFYFMPCALAVVLILWKLIADCRNSYSRFKGELINEQWILYNVHIQCRDMFYVSGLILLIIGSIHQTVGMLVMGLLSLVFRLIPMDTCLFRPADYI